MHRPVQPIDAAVKDPWPGGMRGAIKFAGPTAQGVLDPAYRFSISDNFYSLIFDPLTGDKINEVYLPL